MDRVDLEGQLASVRAELVEALRQNAELLESLRAMELQALQAQVNPHFLFNTLATIAAQAQAEGAAATADLVGAVARLLRYSLRRIGQVVTVAEEVRHVRDYLRIQEARFGDRIAFHVDVPEALHPVRIPILTLQPLVENAIIHGLDAAERGRVWVRGRREGPRAVLEVRDDGVGIPPERLATLFEPDPPDAPGGARGTPGPGSAPERAHVTGLGLKNVHKRLQYYFGEAYGLRVTSRPGAGTAATVVLPAGEEVPA